MTDTSTLPPCPFCELSTTTALLLRRREVSMLKDERAYTGRSLFVNDSAAAMGLVLACLIARTKRPHIPKPPTPAQIAARERAGWNAEVARRKAEKQAKKGGQHGTE